MFQIGPPRASWSAILPTAIILAVMVAVIPAAGFDNPAPPPEGPEGEGPGETETPGETESGAIHPDAVSVFLKRTYAARPKKLWKALVGELPSAGYPPEEVDEARRTVKTSFVDFDQENYAQPVAEMPPRFGGGYTILQMVKVKLGKVSIEGIVKPIEGGSELQLRARLLVQGLDRKRGIRVLTDRRSAGVIEGEFLARLESHQGLKRLQD